MTNYYLKGLILSTPAKTVNTNTYIDHTPLLSQSLLYFGPKNIRKTLALDRNNRVFDISTCLRKSKARNVIDIFSRYTDLIYIFVLTESQPGSLCVFAKCKTFIESIKSISLH